MGQGGPSPLPYTLAGSVPPPPVRLLPGLVLTLAIVLAGAVVLPCLSRPWVCVHPKGPYTRTEEALFSGPLSRAIVKYRTEVGRYPRALAELTTQPADLAVAGKLGDTPLVEPGEAMDAWGNPFLYRSPGIRHPAGFDLWSMGPDGMSGTEDDIENW